MHVKSRLNYFRGRAAVLGFAAALGVAGHPGRAADAPARGDLRLGYVFAATGETMPYRLFVPQSYDPAKPAPLVVVLHGGGQDENWTFDSSDLKAEAERRGYLLLAVRGYNPFGGYGDIYPVVVTKATAAASTEFRSASAGGQRPPRPSVPSAPLAVAVDDYAEQPAGELTDPHASELSEQESLAALAEVRRAYAVDPARIYLMGNSMGGVGTMYLAAKHPELWAAISPSGGPIAAWSYPYFRLRGEHVAALFVHGELDAHSNPHWSELLASTAKAEGVDASFLLVPGGSHGDAWTRVLPRIFDFFDQHARTGHASAGVNP